MAASRASSARPLAAAVAAALLCATAAAQKLQSNLTCLGSQARDGGFAKRPIVALSPFILDTPRAVPALAVNTSASPPTNPWAKPWAAQSCCSETYSNELQNGLVNLYSNWSYDYCGKMSSRCAAFFYAEEAFYQCDPFAYQFLDPTSPYAALLNAPLCASYCEDWYSACADDSTCASNWVNFPTDDNFTCVGRGRCVCALRRAPDDTTLSVTLASSPLL